ncbi:MAG: S41 family peptidase [Mesotoga sp.]|uniref:S41 family peptidase n=1 Tax=unclassified Mesotoga TaxID=1184398 RepID=UPI000EF264F9|nr:MULTISPECIES: S41 family peptidase [unclassified Mesotoga]MDI9368373.1 S41 family peptidase [Thermotogota bacterium]NLT44595.1 S41 family peptidase [Thermotogaceae bacterium]MDD2333572.1 S41 family peptidase [Mesotoga sp.]MDD3681851.1 S41 family peptidase [Mesotoga sp.]MDD4206820.1 S41 family peptidase [Mesotoga sp.]
MSRGKALKIVASISVLVSVFFLGAFTSMTEDEVFEKFSPVFQILSYIDRNYYDIEKVDYDAILNETLTGTMRGLDDPFAWYFDPVQTKENELDTTSKYGGIGSTVQYNIEFDCLEVVAPMAGSPSEKVGLKTGDLILTIDDVPVSDVGYYGAVNMLRGDPGTDVMLEVYRESVSEPFFVEITRAFIEIRSVKSELLTVEDLEISYIQITGFNAPTYDEFQDALNLSRNSKAYIIDLRNNPGGLLQSVLNISSLMLPKGQRVITIRYRDGQEEVYNSWGSRYNTYFADKPIVVLVNDGSASASEILTGALKDHGLATVIGTKTFGKAAVQTVFNLSNGGEIWLPTAHYFTPDGNDIHLQGIEPDIVVEPGEDVPGEDGRELTLSKASVDVENDLQLSKALETILEQLGAKTEN